jgi:cell division protein FtsB
MNRYKRHPRNASVLLLDYRAAEDFKAKKSLEAEVESLKTDINNMKAQIEALKTLLNTPKSN